MRRTAWIIGLVIAGVAFTHSILSNEQLAVAGTVTRTSYQSVIAQIAQDIEGLKSDYPQLRDFAVETHCDRAELVIAYGYQTHQAPRQGGWTSGVPNPGADGVWFYIDFHDPASQRQIHTQPMVVRYQYRDQAVMFLILEGERSRSIQAALVQILKDNGVTKKVR